MSRTKVKNVSDLKPESEGRQWAHHEPGLFLSLCCVKRVREPVRTCVSARMGKKVSQHVCVFLLSLCVLAGAGGRAEVRALREELIRISISRLLGQYHPNSHSCGDDNIISETLQMLRFLRRLSLKMFGCPINVYLPFPKSYWQYEARFKYKYMATNWSTPGPGSDQT